jgi:hypothetical protein
LIKRFPEAKLLGLTATPERLDGRGLGDWFEHMIVGPGTSALIDQGYLSKFKYFAPGIPDMRGVRVRGGEYDPGDLEKVSFTIVGDVIDHFKEKLAPTARALAFCVSVKAACELAARFNKAGIPAKCVDWKTPQAKRDKAVRDLASGKLRVLTNKEVFTEGFDLPAIDAVLLLRPTKSFALYRQMIGRCLRIAKGKLYTTILDHAGLIADHPFPDTDGEWSLRGRRSGIAQSSSYPRGLEIRRCPECSAVNKFSAKCPECGYVYQIKDRSVEEIYGELREITEGAEYESQTRFARRCKVASYTIAKYIKEKELVTYGPRRLIKIKEGLARVEWLRENEAKYETQREFAKRVGVHLSVIRKLTKLGLPKAKNGWVCIEGGLAWLKREGLLTADGEYITRQSRPGFDNRWSFAKRLSASPHVVTRLIDEGLPINERRLIPVEDGLAWLKREGLLTADGEYIRPPTGQSRPGFDSRKRFAKRIGIDPATVRNWIKKGMPINDLNLIPVDAAMQWLKGEGCLTADGKHIKRQPRLTPGFDNQKSFGKRIGVHQVTIRGLIKKGLPIDERGLIPVEGGLAWLRRRGRLTKDGEFIRRPGERPAHAKKGAGP